MNATSPIGGVPAARAAAAVIEMIDVSIGLAGAVETAAVEGIHCAIAAGDYWVIGGPPGSGKTWTVPKATRALSRTRAGRQAAPISSPR